MVLKIQPIFVISSVLGQNIRNSTRIILWNSYKKIGVTKEAAFFYLFVRLFIIVLIIIPETWTVYQICYSNASTFSSNICSGDNS